MKPIKGISFYMVPFNLPNYNYTKNAQFSRVLDSNIWKPSEMKIEKDVFYPYIQSFLQSSVTTNTTHKLQPHDYLIYSADTTKNKLLQIIHNCTMFIQLKNGKDIKRVHFSLLNHTSNFLSTKLVICPNASVGILMFAVEIKDKGYTLKDFMDFNYYFHKTGSQLVNVYLKEQIELQEFAARCEESDSTTKNPNETEILMNRRRRLSERLSVLDKILNRCTPTSEADGKRTVQESDKKGKNIEDELRYWNLDSLLNVLLKGIYQPTERFNKNRCHVFSYLQLPECEFDAKLKADFIRIYRCENEKYLVIDNDYNSLQQTFKNIYVGCSVEGGAILTITPEKENSFINQFWSSSLQQRYLWIYLMVIIQRHSLLYMLLKLTMVDDYYSNSTRVSLKRLREIIKKTAEIKVNTNFTEISDYTQHNSYYRFCSQQLGIESSFVEIDQKTQTINEHLNQLSNKKKEDNEEALTIFLAILTIASASNDGLDTMAKLKIIDPASEWYVYIGYVLVMSMFVCILTHIIFRILKR